MPLKPLPRVLIKRVRKLTSKKLAKRKEKYFSEEERFLGKLKNIDPRTNPDRVIESDVRQWGGRVRALNVNRNFPELGEVVLKRVHSYPNAMIELRAIKRRVREHNKKIRSNSYILKAPFAYPISKNVLLMSKISRPTLRQILGDNGHASTAKGREFFVELKREHGVSKRDLVEAAQNVRHELYMSWGNILLVGVEKGKFVFVPLVDLK